MLIPLVRALYGFEPLEWTENEYREAMREIDLFSVSSQVYQFLSSMEHRLDVPIFVREWLEGRFHQGRYQNLYMKHREERLLRRLDDAGIPAIPLKGVRFAETYYGHPAARLTSDIDLFVPFDRLQEAIRCAEADGFLFEIVKDHHARLQQGGLLAELHWTLDKQFWSDLDPAPFRERALPLDGFSHARILSPLDTLYFICLHGARHQMDSLRYVLDVAQIVRTAGRSLDGAELVRRAGRDKTLRRVKAVLSIVYRQFPELGREMPLPFRPIETGWEYRIIRDARNGVRDRHYYRYKLFFRHFIFDTFRHQARSIGKAY